MRHLTEVRCCCDPKKLRGYLRIDTSVKTHTFVLRPRQDALPIGDFPHADTSERITMHVTPIQDNGDRWLALKAEDVPLEDLERIEGFIPA